MKGCVMTDDIVTRLRDEAARCQASPCDCQCPNLNAAADEIERLRDTIHIQYYWENLLMEESFRLRDEIKRLNAMLPTNGMSAIDKVDYLHQQIVNIVKGYND